MSGNRPKARGDDLLVELGGEDLGTRPDAPVYVRADHRLDYGQSCVMTVLQKAGAKARSDHRIRRTSADGMDGEGRN
jgi:hypothetical protein